MVEQKYKIDVRFDLVFIIFGPFLQIINIYRIISLDKIVKSSLPLYLIKPITMELLFLEHKVTQVKNYWYEFLFW